MNLLPRMDLETLESVKRLSVANSDFARLVEYLKGAQADFDRQNRTAQPPRQGWLQGAAQLLDDVVSTAEHASELHRDALQAKQQQRAAGSPG